MKVYLSNRGCHSSYTGGISSFILFYMVLVFYQIDHQPTSQVPDILRFLNFYADFDELNFGLQVDLKQLFPDEDFYQREIPPIVKLQNGQNLRQTSFKRTGVFGEEVEDISQTHFLFIKDPIGRIFYADDSEKHLYRENIAQSAFDYQRVKSEFRASVISIRE
jgi:hypothetical protein